jgi:hypothetical protein
MPVRINNLESEIAIAGEGQAGGLADGEVERIVQLVMERIRDEQARMGRIDEETKITNKVSKPDLFD